ncbi:UNVERIFIED_CONTAM: hypothetical protein FKN15_044489 [Acipenser sinensis]
MDVLHRNIEYMVSQTYSWFSHSTLHQNKYRNLYATINVGEAPLKILQLSDTRWLTISQCVDQVLSQYEELKLHSQLTKDTERNYNAELLYQMYSYPVNRMYLVFLQPFVTEVNRINKLFQLDSANPAKLLADLMTFYRSLIQRIMKPHDFPTWSSVMDFDITSDRNSLPLSAVDFGIKFQLELSESKIEPQKAEDIKRRCRDYMFKFLKEIKQRLPPNIQQLESLAVLSPSVVLSSKKPQLAHFCHFTMEILANSNSNSQGRVKPMGYMC